MNADEDLDLIKRRRLLEMRRRALLQSSEPKKSSEEKEKPKGLEEVLKEVFVGRAWEVWAAAKEQYPIVAQEVGKAIVSVWTSGRLKDKVTGEQLYWLFRNMRFPVRLHTKIRILEDGEAKSIAEKLRER